MKTMIIKAVTFLALSRADTAAPAPSAEEPRTMFDWEGPRVPALDPSTVDPANFLTEEDIESIARRRAQGLRIPELYYEKCHFWINAVRARENLPALRRWKEMESCSDDMAAYDHVEYRDKRRPHAAFQDGVGCTMAKTGQRLLGQNSCPMWPNNWESIMRCTVRMWEEKVDPGVNPNTLACNGPDSECGHYWTLRGGKKPSEYNKYDRVACGFYIDPSTEELYINQNFGNNGGDFLCGGNKSSHPPAFVDDCAATTNDYADCADDRYDEYGCDYRYCDPEYSGTCTDNAVCSRLGVEYERCQAGKYSTGGGVWTPFTEGCRATCKTCACTNKPAPRPKSTPRPVAPPTPRPIPAPRPTSPVPRPTARQPESAPAPAPQPQIVGPCSKIGTDGRTCTATEGCEWDWSERRCKGADGTCEGIGTDGKACEMKQGCAWDWSLKHCVKVAGKCEKIGSDGKTCENTSGCQWDWAGFTCVSAPAGNGTGPSGPGNTAGCNDDLPRGYPKGRGVGVNASSICDCEATCIKKQGKAYAWAKKKSQCVCFKKLKFNKQGEWIVKSSKKFSYALLGNPEM